MMQSALRFLRSAGLIEFDVSVPEQIDEEATENAQLNSKKYIAQAFNQQLNVLIGTSGYSFMRTLPLDILVELAPTTRLHQIQAGKQFITKGENENSMYLVSRGSIEIKIESEEGSKKTLATLWPGDCLGEMSLLTGAPRSADAMTKTEVTLLEITSDDLSPVLHKYPILANAMAEAVLQRKNQTSNALLQHGVDANESPKSLLSKIVLFFKIKKS
jgi:CRP-like cAMP-binding protein